MKLRDLKKALERGRDREAVLRAGILQMLTWLDQQAPGRAVEAGRETLARWSAIQKEK